MRLPKGTLLGPYQISSFIGGGGMGDVYRAFDTRLARDVALKVLPEHLAADGQFVDRFQKETRALAALSHPNILSIFDVGRDQDCIFAVMELLDGETLRARLDRSPLDSEKALEIATEIAYGLVAAHSKGIIHRDLKPENVFLIAEDRVKILDFGLAQLRVEPVAGAVSQLKTQPGQTKPGMLLGTVGYMSPEQVKGMEVDATTDLFSFGNLFCEMLTGKAPFLRNTAAETFAAILNDDPPASLITDTGPVPVELRRIVLFCLQKNPVDRFHSARDLYVALKMLSHGSSVVSSIPQFETAKSKRPRRKKKVDSVAVLPFLTEGSNPEMEYLGGVAETIINTLSQTPKLRVMAYGTVLRYAGGNVDPLRAGRELNVRAVLSGRIVKRGDALDIQAELIDVMDGAQLWGKRYSAEICEVCGVEEEIAKKISDKLRIHLTQSEQKRLSRKMTANKQAYDLYLKGRYFWNKRTDEGLRKAKDFFEQAILEDSSFALAYSGLADTYWILGSYGFIRPRDAYPHAKQYAIKALELDSGLAEAHCSLAEFLFRYDWNWDESVKEFEISLKLNPGYATAHHWYAVALVLFGKFEKAVEEIKKARDLDPFSPVINWSMGYIYYYARQYDKAIEQFRYTLLLDPTFFRASTDIAMAYVQKSMFEEAVVEIEKRSIESELTSWILSSVGYTYAMAGRIQEAEKMIEELKDSNRLPYVSYYAVAVVYVGLRRDEEALDWMERAFEEREDAMTSIKVNPRLDPLRSNPRFKKLVEHMALP
ncbi:protein kinase [bacterium]|nr:protein kinase [bacterium]MCI0605581.1 protein kinase [bacterium]